MNIRKIIKKKRIKMKKMIKKKKKKLLKLKIIRKMKKKQKKKILTLNVNEAFETLGRELIIASEEKKITKQKQNKKITVAKAQDLNVEKKNGCC